MQVVVAGGGPAGAVAARTLAKLGIRTVLIEAAPDADKPCAGAIPSVLLDRYPVPKLIIKSRCLGVIFQGPSGIRVPVDFPDGLYIATVQRSEFDSHLRFSAEDAGAMLVRGRVLGYEDKGGMLMIHYKDPDGAKRTTEADFLIAADGAVSRIARQTMGKQLPMVIAVQEEIEVDPGQLESLCNRCLFNYSPAVSPDFYGWIFPKDGYVSIGVGTRLDNRNKINDYLARMKEIHSDLIRGGKLIKRNGAMIPTSRYQQYGSNRIILTGDSAGFVLPAAGEGIYFAMRSGEMAASSIFKFARERPDLVVPKYTNLVNAEFNPVFRYFNRVQRIAYSSARNREVFVRLTQDKFMGQKILRAFASKNPRKTPPLKKLQVMFGLMAIRADVARRISKQADFGV